MSKRERHHEADTAIGGNKAAFPNTPASAVLGVGSEDPINKARAFTALVRAYWKPIYKRVRTRFSKTNEEAKDLTQSFFARAFEQDTFGKYDPEGARFRTYVRRCLDNYVLNAEQARKAQKRGGGAIPLSLHFEEAESELASSGKVDASLHERFFDDEFVRELYRASLETLRQELIEKGKEIPLQVFERYDLIDPNERPTYMQLADDFEVKTTDVTNYLHSVRKTLRTIVLAKLKVLTANDEEFRSEALELLGIDLGAS